MSNQAKSVISKLLALCMIITLSAGMLMGIPAVSAAVSETFEPNYGGNSVVAGALPDGWSGVNIGIEQPGWGNFYGEAYGGSGNAIYDQKIWEGPIDYTWKFFNISGNTKTTYIYFYYTDANNYYALEITAGKSRLIKVVDGKEQALGEANAGASAFVEVSVRIVRDGNGMITVYKGARDTVPTEQLFQSSAADASNPTGKIGVGFVNGGFRLVSPRVVGTASSGGTPTASPTVTPTPGGNVEDKTFTTDWKDLTAIPDGWTGNGFSVNKNKLWLDGGAWGDAGQSCRLIYEPYKWTGKLDYTIGNYQLYGSGQNNQTGVIYFYYADASNYYALEMTVGGTRIVKVVNGEATTLGETTTNLVDKQTSLRIVRDTDGSVAVYTGSFGNMAPNTLLLESDKPDTAAPVGKIGIGFIQGGGFFGSVKVVGSVTDQDAPPSEELLPAKLEFNHRGTTTYPKGWSGNWKQGDPGIWIEDPANWAALKGSAYNGTVKVVYDGFIWEGKLDYTWTQMNNYDGQETMLFYYNDANNYYGLQMTSTVTQLIKVENGQTTVLGETTTKPMVHQNKDLAVRVVYDNGDIIAYQGAPGSVPTAEWFRSNVKDTAAPKGKVGMQYSKGGGHASGLLVTGTARAMAVPEPSPLPTPEPPKESTPPAIPSDKTVTLNNAQGAPDASKWTGSGFEVGTFSDYKFNANQGALIYNADTWYGYVDVTIPQISINSLENAYLYFMYQDENNYYALKMNNDSTELIKKQGGEEESLGKVDTSLIDAQRSIRVIREANGTITVWKGAKDSFSPAEHVMTSSRRDVAFHSGWIGLGYDGRTGGSAYVTNPVVKGVTTSSEGAFPIATPKPATVPSGAVTASTLDESAVRKVGRAYELNDAVNVAYPLAGIEFNVANTQEVYLELSGKGMYGVFVDDAADCARFSSNFGETKNYVKIASFAGVENHKIRVIKLDGWDNSIGMTNIAVSGTSPTITASTPKTKKIEIVGDSITVGSGMFVPSSPNAAIGSEGWLSYAGQVAAYFNADASMAARGGGGFTKPEKDWYNTYHYYQYADQKATTDEYKWDFNQFRPDIIIVNIGTNGGAENTKDMYVRFYNQIRETYNDTNNEITILFAYGAMELGAWPALHAAYEEISQYDSNVYELQLKSGMNQGVGSHPTYEQHKEIAAQIISKIEEIKPEWATTADVEMTANRATGAISITNNTEAAVTGDLLIAKYDDNGLLVDVSTVEDVTVAANGSADQTATFDSDGTYKVFFWKSELQPLCEEISL